MHTTFRNTWLAIPALSLAFSSGSLWAQFAPESQKQLPPPAVNWTADQDHQNMMDQLGIKALRPGPSGNESDPNHANYDETKANPYPDLPDVLKSGGSSAAPRSSTICRSTCTDLFRRMSRR
jgi:hypothetical protein